MRRLIAALLLAALIVFSVSGCHVRVTVHADPSGHRITDIAGDIAVAAADEVGESVVVTYEPGQHRSVFSRAWLAEHPEGPLALRARSFLRAAEAQSAE